MRHLLWLLLLPSLAFGANSAVLTIAPPTLNTDGSTITGALLYTIWQGPCGAEVQVASGVTATSWTADPTKLLPGTTVCWKVTAQYQGGPVSAFSPEVKKTFPALIPSAPGLTVQ